MGYGRKRDGDKMGFGFKAGTWQKAATSKVRNAQERLRRLEDSPVDRPPVPLRLAAPELDLLRLEETTAPASRPWRQRSGRASSQLTARRNRPEKILITGANGAGKSTLLSVLAGTLSPPAGA